MAEFKRAEHCRAIASKGGRSTVAKYGPEHMRAIGKRGFAKAVELGWGVEIASKLRDSYIAKFGKPPTLGRQSREAAAIRAGARRLYDGLACDNCCNQAGQVHHIQGLRTADPNEPTNIRVLCADCHRAEHRRRRAEHREGR